eukprot:9502396-Pyramimonas_sp.AAC.1
MAPPAIPADAAQGMVGEHSGIRQFLDKLKSVYELHDQDRRVSCWTPTSTAGAATAISRPGLLSTKWHTRTLVKRAASK